MAMLTRHQVLCSLFALSSVLATTSAFSLHQATRLASGIPLLSKEDSSVETETCAQPLTQENGDLPIVIQQIADERQEFNMNLGKAMDTLKKDIPEILRTAPDYSIYHKEITVIDPSGVRLEGLENYKSSMAFFRSFIKFWFSASSRLQHRTVYDFCRSSIRVSWNLVLIPKIGLGRPVFLDGVSHYKLDPKSGKIIEHKIENLVMNDTPVAPPYGIFSILQQEVMGGAQRQPVPVGAGAAI